MTALRSGEYAQAKNRLRGQASPGRIGYCCEGVAVTRYAEQLGYRFEIQDTGSMRVYGKYDGPSQFQSTAVAPPEFWEEMGMRDVTVYNGLAFELPGEQTVRDQRCEFIEYAALNDADFTFDQIADLMEWQFLR